MHVSSTISPDSVERLHLTKTWLVGQKKVELYRSNGFFKAMVFQNDEKWTVSNEWITGLPNSKIRSNYLFQRFLENTYIRLTPLMPSGYKIDINQRIKGGMFTRHVHKKVNRLVLSSPISEPASSSSSPPTLDDFSVKPLHAKMNARGDRQFKILTIDGGGIIPLKVRCVLERLFLSYQPEEAGRIAPTILPDSFNDQNSSSGYSPITSFNHCKAPSSKDHYN